MYNQQENQKKETAEIFQIKIINRLINNPEFLAINYNYINNRDYPKNLNIIIVAIKNFYTKYKNSPTFEELRIILENNFKNEIEIAQLNFSLDEIENCDNTNFQFIEDTFLESSKKIAFEKLYEESLYRSQENISFDFPKELEKLTNKFSTKTDWLSSRIDNNTSIEEEVIYISKDGNTIASRDNIMAVTGKVGQGKTSLVTALVAGMIAPEDTEVDSLGFDVRRNIEKKAVIYIDTEMSASNVKSKVYETTLRRAGLEECNELCILSYKKFTWKERQDNLKRDLEDISKLYGGVYAVVLDGGADFLIDINDTNCSVEFVNYCNTVVNKYKCLMIHICHLNHSSEEKMRGHYGSNLEMKAESILRVGQNQVSFLKLRNSGNISEPTFQWSDEKNMFVYNEDYEIISSKTKKINTDSKLFADLFTEKPELTYNELIEKLVKKTGKAQQTVKDKITKAKKAEIILNENGIYKLFVPEVKPEPQTTRQVLELIDFNA